MKSMKKALAVFLVILTVFTSISVTMPVLASYDLATAGNVTDGNVPEDEELPEESEPEAQILSEITEKREENAKHFLMSDGSFMVAQYDGPVHELDNDGNWVDINNTITEAQATTEQTELFGTDELYSTGNITDNVVFAEKSNSNTLVSYEAKDYPISLNYQSAKNSKIKIIEKDSELTGNDAYLSLPNITQEVIYEDALKNVDLQYFVSPTQLKENIILKNKNAQNTFTVNYNIGELTAEVIDTKTVNLMAGDEVVYTITAPYMTDANGEKSENITLNVDKNHNGKLRIDITADSTWLQAENRAYPVVVDPSITTETTRTAIDSVMIAEAQPNTNYSEQAEMIVGREPSEYGYCRVLAKIQLPTLNKGDIIVGAQLNILNYGLWPYADSTPDMQVNAHVLTEDWSVSTVTWSNQPSYNSIVSDYDVFEEMTESTWRQFDVTKIAKQWYEDPDSNYGIMLKGANTTGTYAENGVKAYMYTERYNQVDDAYPQILLTYRNNKGLEDYWTYTSLSAGAAGSAYINDYTGNLVFASNVISSSNELMPLSVDCVYNGYVSDKQHVSGKNYSNITLLGKGWKLSVQQTVIPSDKYGLTGDAAENYPYVYTDGDGTEHYIYKKTEDGVTTYEDEDGLGLTLKTTSTGYTLTDKKDNKLIFNEQGNLIKSQDADGNYIQMTYDSAGTKLKKITDGAGKVFTLTYETEDDTETKYIDYITDPSGNKINFTYSGYKLTKITRPDGTTSTFTYDDTSDTSLLSAKDNDKYQLTFTYTTAEKGKRISKVSESADGTAGQSISFNRSKYNTTTITTAGTDGVSGNNDDLITTYQFDNFGKTVTQQLKTDGGTDSVAGVYNYTDNEAADLKTVNKVSSSASLGKNVVNYVKGGNAESFSNWTDGPDSAAVSTIGVSSDAAYIGQKSILVNNTEITASGANVNAYQDISGLTGGETYTLSAYVKTQDLAVYSGTGGGAYVCIRAENAEGTNSYYYSEYIKKDSETAVNKGWRRITSSVTLPDGVTSVRVYAGLRNHTGKAYFDCIQLEKGSVANDFNLLQNSSFERYSSGMPTNWSAINLTYTASDTTVYEGITEKYKKEGTKSLVIKGDADSSKGIGQTVTVYGDPNDTYIISAWARANAVNRDVDNHPKARFQITVQVNYDDGKGGTYSEYKNSALFNTTISGWQYTAQTFTLKSEDHPSYQPVSIRINPIYNRQVNYAYFDHIQLIKDVAQSYTYDSEGNVVSVSANAEQKDNMEYEDNDLKTYTDVLGNKTTYEYNSTHHVTKATTPGGTQTLYNYNDNGQQTSSKITNSSNDIVIQTGIGYTEKDESLGIKAGAYVSVVSDEHKNRTYYEYDMLKGLTTKVTNVNGVETNYTYDSKDRLTKVASGNTSVSYTYSGNKLNTIKYGNDTYSFEYDVFGNIISTKINGKALSANTYGANNGVLEKTTYGNGTVRSYTYDNFGNLRTVRNTGGSLIYTWLYDSSMTPKIHRDYTNDLKYDYSYDAIGRLIRQNITDLETGSHVGSNEYTYDLRNNVTKIATEMGGRTITQKYRYSEISGNDATVGFAADNLPTRYIVNSARHIDYSYDSINRLQSKTLNTVSPLLTTYSYKLSDRNEGTESSKYRTTQISTEHSGKLAYYYTYDKLGNVVDVNRAKSDGSGNVIPGTWDEYRSYQYDDLNQLTREDNKTTNETYIYEYDYYGNIKSKTVYPYSTSDLGTATSTVSYTYGTDTDAGWKNLLTSYNGEAIDYDEIGNPTTYRGAALTWYGRQLRSYTKDGVTNTYTYDADGLRATKTVGSEKTTYHYVDGQLLYEDRNGTDIYYYYDSYGIPTAIRYYEGDDFTTIYIFTNSLGDVTSLYSKEGEMLVKYEYDAWGNIISETDASGNALAGVGATYNSINPFRYRGYYYDSDIGLYYLQSRYYDAEVGRFINQDSYVSTGTGLLGFNMFAYCGNNPVNWIDPTGHCYYAANGVWSHDAWENLGGYEKKPDPGYYVGTTDSGTSVYVAKTENYSVPPGSVKVVDLRDTNMTNGKHNPDIRIVNSYKISDISEQKNILNLLVEYNQTSPSEYKWTRNVDSMVIEWVGHNEARSFLINIGLDAFADRGTHVDLDEKERLMFIWQLIYDNYTKVGVF